MRIKDNEKIQQLIDFCEKNKVNVVQAIETNSKWNTITKSIIRQKFARLGRSLEIVFADSKVHSTTKNNWLQGGILNLIGSRIPSLLRKEEI